MAAIAQAWGHVCACTSVCVCVGGGLFTQYVPVSHLIFCSPTHPRKVVSVWFCSISIVNLMFGWKLFRCGRNICSSSIPCVHTMYHLCTCINVLVS